MRTRCEVGDSEENFSRGVDDAVARMIYNDVVEKWRNYGDGPGGRISEDRHNKFGSSCQVYWGGIWQSP